MNIATKYHYTALCGVRMAVVWLCNVPRSRLEVTHVQLDGIIKQVHNWNWESNDIQVIILILVQ